MRKVSVNLMKTPRNASAASKNKALTFQLFSNNEGIRVHTGEGYMKIGKYCKDIPELVAASFSMCVLVLMCEPRPQIFLNQGLPAYPKDPTKIPGLKTFDNLLIYNCGYMEPMYNNSWMYWYYMCRKYKHKDAPPLPSIAKATVDFDKSEEKEEGKELVGTDGTATKEKEDELQLPEEKDPGRRKLERRRSATRKVNKMEDVFCPWDPEGTGNHGAEVAIASSANGGEYYSIAVEAALCGACSTSLSTGYFEARDGAGFSSDSGVGSGSASDGATSGGYGSGDNSSFGGDY